MGKYSQHSSSDNVLTNLKIGMYQQSEQNDTVFSPTEALIILLSTMPFDKIINFSPYWSNDI